MKRKWTVGLAVAAALVLGAAGVFMAGASAQEDGNVSLLDRVAGKLGIDRGTLDQAIVDSRNEQIDEAVASGDLTQEQADRLKEKLAAMPDGAPLLGHPGFGSRLLMPGDGKLHFGFGLREGAEKLSGYLGITEEELREQLQAEGATLASVAEANGKTRDELKSFIESESTAAIDERVAAGDLTQERADEIKATMAEHIDGLVDREWPGPHRRFEGFRDRFGGDDGAEEQSGTTERSFRS